MTPIIIGAYILFLIIFSILSFFGLYQLAHFGYVGDASRQMIVIYLGLSLLIIISSIVCLILFL